MAGNSRRGGAQRTPGSKKGAVAGTGGKNRKQLTGRGPTPPARARPGHPAQRQADSAERVRAVDAGSRGAGPGTGGPRRAGPGAGGRGPGQGTGSRGAGQVTGGPRRSKPVGPELLVGRNPVLEALRADIPAAAVYVARGMPPDDRIAEALRLAADSGLPIMEITRADLDRMTGGVLHQGVGISVPAYDYPHPDDVLARALDATEPALLVALDGVTDPRNLGAVIRSVAAFGGHGVVVPERRAAAMTATAWRTSAGAAARLPVARATNLARTLKAYASAGLQIVGLAADGDVSLDELDISDDPVCVVAGSEGKGLSRLVREGCDVIASIPISRSTESLNASVAAAVVLAEIARRRRTAL